MKNLVVVVLILLVTASSFALVPEAAFNKALEINPARDIEKYAIRHDCNARYAMRDKSDSSYITAATQYLAEKVDLFLLRDDLKATEVISGPASKHVTFQQFCKGLPVFESTIHVHFDSSDSIVLVNGSYKYNLEPRMNEKNIVPRSDALNTVINKIKPASYTLHSTEMVYINDRNDELVPAYSFKIITESPVGNWLACVDRSTGEIISLEDHIMYFNRETTGKGYVYKDHPGLSDKILENLLHLTGEGKLKGKWAVAINEDFEGAISADHKFLYEMADTHFDEVLVYYNVNQVHDYAKNVLKFDKMDFPMNATVHVRENYDNAYFMPWTGGIYFGDGNKFNDLSHEGSVLFHEYGHAMLQKILSYSGGEAGAINEAQADYIACTMTDDSELGEYVCAKIDRPNIRDMQNKTHYPEDIHNEVHYDGLIWGGALWDIRKAIGQKDADQLLHQYKFLLPKYNGKFVDARQAVIKTDNNLYGGKHVAIINKIMDARGILKPVDPSVERSRIAEFLKK